jgi:hypothetical protein
MTDQVEITEKHVGRRAVVRTAAHAAWAIPAIQIATTVSAHAATCSGGQATNISIDSPGTLAFGKGNDSKKFTKTHSVTNLGGAGTATLRVTPSAALKSGTAPTVADVSWVRSGSGPWDFQRVIGDCAGHTKGGVAQSPVTFAVTGEFADNGGTKTVSVTLV